MAARHACAATTACASINAHRSRQLDMSLGREHGELGTFVAHRQGRTAHVRPVQLPHGERRLHCGARCVPHGAHVAAVDRDVLARLQRSPRATDRPREPAATNRACDRAASFGPSEAADARRASSASAAGGAARASAADSERNRMTSVFVSRTAPDTSTSCATNMSSDTRTSWPFSHTSASVARPSNRSTRLPATSLGSASNWQRYHQSRSSKFGTWSRSRDPARRRCSATVPGTTAGRHAGQNATSAAGSTPASGSVLQSSQPSRSSARRCELTDCTRGRPGRVVIRAPSARFRQRAKRSASRDIPSSHAATISARWGATSASRLSRAMRASLNCTVFASVEIRSNAAAASRSPR